MAINKKNFFLLLCLIMLSGTTFFSCTADEEIVQTPVSEDYKGKAKEMLTDSIVFYTRAMQSTVNKTLLEEGCPVKYFFEWRDGDVVNVQIRNFSVGKMPVRIWYSINCKLMQLNTWEKDEYTGEGWIKFQGSGGVTDYTGEADGYTDGNGGDGYTTGYLNVLTKELEMACNFNVMLMQSSVYRQTIIYSRIDTFEADFAQYEKDLAEYKKEHGIS